MDQGYKKHHTETEGDLTPGRVVLKGVSEEIAKLENDAKEAGPQPTPMIVDKPEYLRLHSFIIGSIATDRDSVDVINSGAEAALVGPRQAVSHASSSNRDATLLLLDRSQSTRQIKQVDAYHLCGDTCSEESSRYYRA